MKRVPNSEAAQSRISLLGVLFAFLLAGCGLLLAQQLRMEGIRVRPDNRPEITFGGTNGHYYILREGDTLTGILSATDVLLGTNGAGILLGRPVGVAEARFFQVEARTLEESGDLDGDGLLDVYELVHPTILNPLVASDALEDPDQDGCNNLCEAAAGTNPAQADQITRLITSPALGETGVAVTRETIVRFTQPLSAGTVLDTRLLYATAAGRRILGRVELSQDRRTATLFHLENLPASTRVRVVFDADAVRDIAGKAPDGDGDGRPGGGLNLEFDTLTITPVAGTAIRGRVFASELVGTNSINRPLERVTVTVDGAEESIRATTDADGNFVLRNCPAGRFFVHVDGRTAVGSQWPDGAYYPFVGKAWEAAAGREDNLAGDEPHAQRTGNIYLPLIAADSLKPVSATEETVIGFPASVLATHPELAGVALRIPPNALLSDSGVRGGRVGIAPVPPDRLPGALPGGLQFPMVITVQTDGPGNFDRPVGVRFPNLPDPATGVLAQPGERLSLVSFNHDVGEWERSGEMVVSPDGRWVDTLPGHGIRQPGWHGWIRLLDWFTDIPPNCSSPGGYAACVIGCRFVSAPVCAGTCVWVGGVCAVYTAGSLGVPCGLICGLICTEGRKYVCATQCAESDCAPNARNALPLLDEEEFQVVDLIQSAARIEQLAGERSLTEAERSAINGLLAQARMIAGVPLSDFLFGIRLREEEALYQTGEPRTFLPSYPIDFAARIWTGDRLTIVRGKTRSHCQVLLAEPVGASVESVWFYDRREGRFGRSFRNLKERGPDLPVPILLPLEGEGFTDTDGDGLGDEAEFVVGTDLANPDSDGDGIPDGVELRNQTDPLDGRPVATGVVASLPLPGAALDVCAFDNRAIVALGGVGVGVLNVFNGLAPTLVAQVDTPGSAHQVACAGDWVAVADGAAGVALVDIARPAEAMLSRQVDPQWMGGGETRSVAMAADRVFAGQSSGHVAMIEAATGVVLQRIELGGSVESLAIEGVTLHAIAGGRLWVLPFGTGVLERRGSVEVSAGRLFVGNARAYIASGPGFRIYDVSNPDAPAAIASESTTQLNWKQMVPTGSGYGLGVVGINRSEDATDDVYLYDLRDGSNAFVTRLETPGVARAASLFNGLGYVADGGAGLQVLNYVAYDSQKQPPVGQLVLSATNSATAGGFVVVRAEVEDDVQVRNVEFLLDGERLAIDGNFPFEVVYRVPTNRIGRPLNFAARAFDTGGNTASLTNLVALPVVPDELPPVVQVDGPPANTRYFDGDIMPVTVGVFDNVGVASVSILVDGVAVAAQRVTGIDYLVTARIPRGAHVLQVRAVDNSGREAVSAPVPIAVWLQAISREISVFNHGIADRVGAVSRELSVMNVGTAPDKPSAVSREISVGNVGTTDKPGAVSREISVGNRE